MCLSDLISPAAAAAASNVSCETDDRHPVVTDKRSYIVLCLLDFGDEQADLRRDGKEATSLNMSEFAPF